MTMTVRRCARAMLAGGSTALLAIPAFAAAQDASLTAGWPVALQRLAMGLSLVLGVVCFVGSRRVWTITRTTGNPFGTPLALMLGVMGGLLLALPSIPGML